MSIYLISGDVNFDLWVMLVSGRCPHFKVTIFPFIVSKYLVSTYSVSFALQWVLMYTIHLHLFLKALLFFLSCVDIQSICN